MRGMLNPLLVGRLMWDYVFRFDLTKKLSFSQLREHQNRVFRNMIRYAVETPVYSEKYAAEDVDVSTIQGVSDSGRIPCVSKDDLIQGYPDGIVPPDFNKKDGFLISSSGSSGRPVALWSDLYTAARTLLGLAAELAEHGISWRKDRLSLIADFSASSPEGRYLEDGFFAGVGGRLFLRHFQLLDVTDDVHVMMQKLAEFSPRSIGGYPPVLEALSVLKEQGYGDNVQPECIASSGAVLTDEARKRIEDAFDAPVFDSYSSAELGAMAFQCTAERYHVHSDLVYIEIIDDAGNVLPSGERGTVVGTRLYGNATPVVRYAGLGDTAKLVYGECSCGRMSPVIEDIKGRRVDPLMLPGGRMMSPFSLTGIPATVMQNKGRFCIEKFQIIQKKINQVELLLVMKEEAMSPRDKDVLADIRDAFRRRLGDEVDFTIKVVDDIAGDHPPVVVSNVKMHDM